MARYLFHSGLDVTSFPIVYWHWKILIWSSSMIKSYDKGMWIPQESQLNGTDTNTSTIDISLSFWRLVIIGWDQCFNWHVLVPMGLGVHSIRSDTDTLTYTFFPFFLLPSSQWASYDGNLVGQYYRRFILSIISEQQAHNYFEVNNFAWITSSGPPLAHTFKYLHYTSGMYVPYGCMLWNRGLHSFQKLAPHHKGSVYTRW
jgi:hypothetical protein